MRYQRPLTCLSLGLLLNQTAWVFSQTADKQLAGERFDNVTALSDMPADQMGKVMNLMSAALGVNCNYCHSGYDFSSEDVPLKQTARDMIEMTLRLNKDVFHGKRQITCNTCHRGRAIPDDVIDVMAEPSDLDTGTESATQTPAAQVVLDRYIEASGGRERLSVLKSRRLIGERIEPDGQIEKEELWQQSDGQSKMTTIYGDLPVAEGFDGQKAWKRAGENEIVLKPDEAEQIQMEVGVAFPLVLRDYYPTWNATTVEQINGRTAHVLNAVRRSGLAEKLIFDAANGLLVRRVVSVPTVLGAFEYRVDYGDYRSIEGVQVPMEFHFAMPNLRWMRRVDKVEWNSNH